MVKKAENYRWSSAASHCGLIDDHVLSGEAKWNRLSEQFDDWSAWLAQGDEHNELTLVRRNIEKGLPCGSDRFVENLEKMIGRSLLFRAQGRPKREE
jgi:putative transposase